MADDLMKAKVHQMKNPAHKKPSVKPKSESKEGKKNLAQKKTKKHSKSHKHHRHQKDIDMLVQENAQLDNLFMKVRDDLLEKPVAHKAKPAKSSLVQLVHKSRMKSKSKDDDETVDE